MLLIDSVKLVMMLMNAALSVTEPIAGFQITGEWVWSHSVQVVKSALSLHKTAPQPSACEVTPVPPVPSTSRHDGAS
jgi:hypothetical protein